MGDLLDSIQHPSVSFKAQYPVNQSALGLRCVQEEKQTGRREIPTSNPRSSNRTSLLCSALLTFTTLILPVACPRRRTLLNTRFVNRKCPIRFVPSCNSNPSFVTLYDVAITHALLIKISILSRRALIPSSSLSNTLLGAQIQCEKFGIHIRCLYLYGLFNCLKSQVSCQLGRGVHTHGESSIWTARFIDGHILLI